MTWSQALVVMWLQFLVGAGLLLVAVRLGLRWVKQPVEKIRMIQAGLVVAIAAPLAMWLVPLPMLRLEIARQAPGASVETVRPDAGAEPAISHLSTRPRLAAVSPAPQREAGVVAEDAALPAIRVEETPVEQASASSAEPETGSRPSRFWTLAAWGLIAIHGTAALSLLAQWGIGLAALRRLYRSARGSTLDLEVAWNSLPGARGRDVELRISSAVDAPLTFGWRRPVVIVPSTMAGTGGTALTFCLAHEWSHIERGDVLTWRAVQWCQFLLWWHPAFWTLRRELRLSQDMLADDRAATIGQGSLEYSELLVDLARQRMPVRFASALTFLDHPSQLTKRVRMLLQPPVSLRSRCSWKFSIAATLVAIGSLLLIGSVRVEATPRGGPARQLAAADDVKPAGDSREKPAESKPQEKENKPQPAEAGKDADELHYTAIVVDKYTGKGIPGATVIVRRSELTSQKNEVIEESKHNTDADGKYSFVIPPAQTAIGALYIELDVEHPEYADRKRFGYALSMIRKNEKLGERPFFENVELWPSEPITGTVLDPDGHPLPAVRVQGYSKSNASDFREYGSFTEATTGEDGKFRLSMIKGGVGVFWVIPNDFAITSRPVGKDRGDVGMIRLQPGSRVSGTVLNAAGKPVGGAPITLSYQSGGTEDVNGLPVASSTSRSTQADDDGHFAFDPLPDGLYRLNVDEYATVKNRGGQRIEINDVFIPMTVTLKEGTPAAPVKFQAAPHVMFNAQIYDSKGEKTRGHEIFLFGQMDGQWWHQSGRPNAEGTIAVKVPHGLEQVRVQLMTNEHGALRFRRGKGKQLEHRLDDIDLGTLNDDVEGFEIIRYKAPLVLISAVDEAGQPIKDFRVSAAYPWGQQRYVLEGELRSDLSFEHQKDGRYRTSQMLPDEKVKFTVTAKGFETATEEVSLPEGESKELEFKMKRSAE